ncbi:electron transfer flavoprotein subunit alpha/FixB family protein [Thioalkalivibrio sp. XN279]|uniref:electron transfer flavoprotein subunit alpha/FixB family protein n=1 Tax=Thioalkalivibrio sp. XN279 TaxID=2714953 RepID=UPI00140802FB|nr:FAD-binding protein [Thioalkalivibrio sp. XN279]NHA15866.1 electron transfer flavoprotein subunit alpha/FixB family protein [Thioalkalivibrio sp. XN279]
MSRVLLIADHDGKTLNTGIARTVACARQLGNVHVAVFHAPDADAACAAAAKLDGVSRVLSVSHEANGTPLAAVLAPQIARLAAAHEGGYDYVLAPSTTFGKDVLPRVAALLGVPQVSDLMEVIDARTFKRPIYAGNVITTVKVPEGIPVLATVRIASFQAVGEAGEAPIVAAQAEAELPGHSRYLGLAESGGSDRPDLQSAPRVVAGGRGVGSKENFEIVFKLADKIGAAVGASRAAVDAGYVPNDMQVGQTGKIIAPDLYIAVGISGAIQHMTGIKDAGCIVAINKDGDAPIFEAADFGLVGDLFTLLPELEKALDA